MIEPCQVRVVSIADWPGWKTRPEQRMKSKPRLSYTRTRDLLRKELRAIRARDSKIEAFFTVEQISVLGWPLPGQHPSEPGVVLRFWLKGREYRMPCDSHATFDENLCAITLTLTDLRRLERYHVVRNGTQYRGFLAAPGGDAPSDEASTISEAVGLLAGLSGCPEDDLRNDLPGLKRAYTLAARKVHPGFGGSEETSKEVRDAYRLVAFLIHEVEVKP